MDFSSLTISDFLAKTASKTPAPGGGAVASVVGALAAALAQMVVSFSLGKKNLVEHQPALENAAAELERARLVLMTLADEDAAAYGLVNELSRLPETDPRRSELPAAEAASLQIPLAVTAASADLLRLFASLSARTNRHLRSDLAIAAILADACARSSAWNARINLPSLAAERRQETESQLSSMLEDAADLCRRVVGDCQAVQ